MLGFTIGQVDWDGVAFSGKATVVYKDGKEVDTTYFSGKFGAVLWILTHFWRA